MRYKARTYRGGNLNRNHSLGNLISTTLTPSLLICFRTTACWRNRTHPLLPLPVELPTLPSFWPSIFPFPAKKKDWKSYLFKETLTISLIRVLLKMSINDICMHIQFQNFVYLKPPNVKQIHFIFERNAHVLFITSSAYL